MLIQELRSSEAVEAAQILSRGMRDNPNNVAAWRMNADRRQRALARFFDRVLSGLIVRGCVLGAYDADRLVGVCGMAPPGRCQPSGVEKLAIVPSLLAGTPMVAIRVLKWVTEWARRDPAQPHWHLGPVVVDTDRQGQGIGGSLVAEFCSRVDANRAPAYLETDKEKNVAFYQKYGFTIEGQGQVLGVPNWYMTRKPAAEC